jgi:hypothetical protein
MFAMARASLLVRAMQLAESGEHIDSLTVESALAVEGYAEAFESSKTTACGLASAPFAKNTGDQL